MASTVVPVVGNPPTFAAAKDSSERKASLAASIFNLTNTTIGAGIVAIPYFFSNSGYLFGSVLILVVAFLGFAASTLLVRAAQESNCWSYMDIAERAYGTKGLVAVYATLLSLTIGVMSSFFVMIGSTGSATLESLVSSENKGSWWTEPTFINFVFTCTILIPLGLQRDLASLSKASLLVIVSLVYLVIMVCYMGKSAVGAVGDDEARTPPGDEDDPFQAAFIGSEFFTAFPIVLLAFGNQLNVQQVVTEMEAPTNARVAQVIVGTQLTVAAFYLIIGLGGYYQFTGATEDNIMANYYGLEGQNLLLFTVARIGIMFVVLLCYPMMLFPGRSCLHSMIETLFLKDEHVSQLRRLRLADTPTTFHLLDKNNDNEISLDELVGAAPTLGLTELEATELFAKIDKDKSGRIDWKEFNDGFKEAFAVDLSSSSSSLVGFLWRHAFVVETMFLIGLTFMISVVVPVLGVLMGYTGAISGTIQASVFPAIFHLKLVQKNKIAARAVLFIATIFGFVSLVVAIIKS